MKKKIISILLGVLAFGAVFQMQAAEPAAAEQTAEAAVIAKVKQGDWLENYAEALAAAKQLKRPVLIDFTGSDWCGMVYPAGSGSLLPESVYQVCQAGSCALEAGFPPEKETFGSVAETEQGTGKEIRDPRLPHHCDRGCRR